MSFSWSRLKSRSGSLARPTVTITGTTALVIPDNRDQFIVNGTSTPVVTTLNATGPILPGRIVTFYGKIGITSAVQFNHNADTTTKGQMELGTGNQSLGAQSVLELVQNETGAWTMRFFNSNS